MKKILVALLSLVIATGLMAEESNSALKDKNFILEINPITSFALTTPHINGEINVEGYSFVMGYLSLASNSAITGNLYNYSGYVINPTFRYYTNYQEKGMDSFYTGVGMLFFKFREEDKLANAFGDKEWAQVTFEIPFVEIGWRWLWESGFTLRTGFQFGYIAEGKFSYYGQNKNDSMDIDDLKGLPYFMVEFALGFAF